MHIALAAALALQAATAAEGPLRALPYVPGLDPAAMDRSVDPCQDFYAYACNGWIAANPVPADKSRWDAYDRLAEDNRRLLWGLLADAARPGARRSPEEKQAGDYFAACMDEAGVERKGAAPLARDLQAVERLASKRDLARLVGRLHPAVGGRLLFGFGSQQSFEDSEQVVAVTGAGGLGLPDRDLYLLDDARSAEVRRAYRAHVEAMLKLAGDAPGAAAQAAEAVLRLETALARASLTRTERRDPHKIWHRTTPAELQALTPGFAWPDYFAARALPRVPWLNVEEPAFLRAVEALLQVEGLPAWKAYLRWHVVDARAPVLSRAFVEQDFSFREGLLRGTQALAPRWKRCVELVDRDLGEALGKVFVARAFPPQAKQEAEAMVGHVVEAMRERIQGLDWMGPETRQAALQKLSALRHKIGHPSRWRDYSRLQVSRGDLAGNVERALRFEAARQLRKIGRPLDRGEWSMTAPTVNAYYDASMNEMNFPAGVLLPPLFDLSIDKAPGYGNDGSTVGHELSHGFDDEGRRFDARGNLRDWWTAADAAAFEERARCVAEQYAAYPVVDDIRINSRLTLGEDLADLAGTTLAWSAWKRATRGQALESRDGLTPDQRFFVGFAQWACGTTRPEALRLRALTDVHSPLRWRVNGVVANLPEFARAFSCPAGKPMVREKPCRVW
ncbi:MAG: M13 family metallopeptidase [Deltaproteobacteria bacterium]|nr:M13 family metallopeptidase [Deltaproteobacteria bacterium]